MRRLTEILGVPIDAVSFNEALSITLSFLSDGKKHMLFTPNPEFVLLAQKDSEFLHILKQADLVVPDGIGIVYASKLTDVKLSERVAGYDLVQAVFENIAKTDKTVYFLGAAPGVAELASKEMTKKYPGLRVVGFHDGYFKDSEPIIKEINQVSPDILLVGLGAPKQEKWIHENLDRINAKLFVGVGGSFDGMSGKVVRAPKFYQKAGLEWLYRLMKEPKRISRQKFIPVFVVKIIGDAMSRKWRK